MASIESLRSGSHRPESPADFRERRRDYHFRAIVQSHLLDSFRNSLEEAGFDEKQIGDLASTLAELPEKAAKQVLALPLELRHRLFRRYHQQVSEGMMSPSEMVADIQSKNAKYGFTLGYHLSDHEVRKQKKGDGFEWNIRGSELDDRDDMKMAYYSEDYINRYKKKSGNYLYIVRAETGEHSAHKRDTKNHWGRAPYLSIIDEFNMHDIEKEIDEAAKKEDATA